MPISYGDHCQGKVPFDSREMAEIVRSRKSKSKKTRSGALDVYRCQFCRKWHLGGGLRR